MKTIIALNGTRRKISRSYLEFLVRVDQDLGKRSDYVGVAPYGSQFTGTANSSSDFDVLLIAGDAKVDTENALQDEVNTIAKGFGTTAHVAHCWDRTFFPANLNKQGNYYSYGHALWPLVYPFIGERSELDSFRSLARSRHASALGCDSEFASKNLEEALHNLIYWELDVHVGLRAGRPVLQKMWTRDSVIMKLTRRGYSSAWLRSEGAVSRAQLWLERIRRIVHN